MIETLNQLAALLWGWMSTMFWQVSLLVLIISGIEMLTRRWLWPQVRYALWLLVFIKLIIPPVWSLQSGMIPRIYSVVQGIFIQESTNQTSNISTDNIPIIPDQVLPQMESSTIQNLQDNQIIKKSSPLGQIHWQTYLMGIWMTGMILFSLLLFTKITKLKQWHKHQIEKKTIPPWFHELLVKTTKRMKLGQLPAIVFSNEAVTPAVYGLLRPVILLPANYFKKISKKETEHVLLHELSHLKRGDLWVHGFCLLLQIIYWFNPFIIWARRQIKHVREMCCDFNVSNVLREKTVEYRKTLLNTARALLTESVEPGMGLLGVFEEPFRLVARLKWLEKEIWGKRRIIMSITILSSLFIALTVLPMANAQKESEDTPNVANTSEKDIRIEEDKRAWEPDTTGWYYYYLDDSGTRTNLYEDTPDDFLLNLPDLNSIKELRIHHAQATDQSMQYVGQMNGLEKLYIIYAQVTDVGIAHLVNLKNLRVIAISNSLISDRSLAYLAQLPRLEEISLSGNQLSDIGLEYISNVHQLKKLSIGGSFGWTITDVGALQIANLSNLEELSIITTSITDKGLDQFKRLNKLKIIWLDKDNFSSTAIQDLKNAIPGLKIYPYEFPFEDMLAEIKQYEEFQNSDVNMGNYIVIEKTLKIVDSFQPEFDSEELDSVSIFDFVVLPNKQIIGLDPRQNQLYFLNENHRINKIINNNSGDFQFAQVWSVYVNNNRLIVWDTGINTRTQIEREGMFHYFTDDGQYIRSKKPEIDLMYFPVCFRPDGHFYVGSQGFRSDSLIYIFNDELKVSQRFGTLEGERIEMYNPDIAGYYKGQMPPYEKNNVLMAYTNSNHLMVAHRALPLLKTFSQNGKLLKEVELYSPVLSWLEKEFYAVNDTLPKYMFMSLWYWKDIATDNSDGIYLLLNNSNRMIVHHYNQNGQLVERLIGPQDNINLIYTNDHYLYGYSNNSKKFYKMEL